MDHRTEAQRLLEVAQNTLGLLADTIKSVEHLVPADQTIEWTFKTAEITGQLATAHAILAQSRNLSKMGPL